MARGDRAKRHGNDKCSDPGGEADLRCRQDARPDHYPHRLVGLQRVTEIADQQVTYPGDVLQPDRLVEQVLVAECRYGRGADLGLRLAHQ